MKQGRRGANENPGRRWTTLLLPAAAVIVFGLTYFLAWMGRPADWSPTLWEPSSPVEGFSLDRSTLGPQGDWLLWFDSSLEAVCAKNLQTEDAVVALDPGDYVTVTPVAVLDGNLLVLRSQRTSNFFAKLKRGAAKIFDWNRSEEDPATEPPPPEARTTYLETVDLRTGETVARDAGLSGRGVLEEASDFELGRVSFSPTGDRFAYWAAQETTSSAPLEATVTEVLRIYGAGSGLRPSIDRTIESPGTFFVRSSLLASIGRSYWIGNGSCLFLSFLDAGSLIPIDVSQNEFEATYSIAEIYRNLLSENPNLLYGPEGIETLAPSGGNETLLVIWGRSEDSILFFHFDSQFRFRRLEIAEVAEYGIETILWLPRSERLLVDDNARDRLVGLSPQGDSSKAYPLPPDWHDGFRILGEDEGGSLVGTNRRMFLRTSSDEGDWETVPLF